MSIRALTIIVTVSVVLTAAALVAAGLALRANQEQRSSACAATLTALDAVADTSAAGIRPVIQQVPSGLPAGLDASFRAQQQQTIAENARRQAVIRNVDLAATKLSSSGFCN